MGTEMSGFELLLLGVLLLVVVLFFGRGLGTMLKESREAPKDWGGLFLPLSGVILFVLLLMYLVSR
ncbi:hypothetical protein VCB98_08680 [Gammaproteobacteria bacterium AB-CW1]|uniref:Uncharacterized protein n=1 Tax=Natronospira elongata TaxID=3110268 RepID=A0AAP6JFY2_9GAMM|nr:hypothetical protein [Gammaproteobacteria bacterium AB-CW1]